MNGILRSRQLVAMIRSRFRMKVQYCAMISWLLLTHLTVGQDRSAIKVAATKHVAGFVWQSGSAVTGDFSCRGRRQQAILGLSTSEIVIAVFVNGLETRPEVLRYSAKARNPKNVKLTTEELDFSPTEDLGYELPGFQRSKSCRGLNLSDGQTDSAHIYWNRDAHRFEDWSL
jgi:hypothetical protein